MPQETALINELNIREMMWFFGTIFNMPSEKIDDQLYFLTKLLELPNSERLIRDGSGGQQRRISFALTMLHEPELLLLDEPTVGVDPLLRSMIWNYLTELTRTKGVTVLVSTHYVDEATKSNQVGFMRNGVRVIEDSPQRIMEMYDTPNLNEAILKLCSKPDLKIVQETFEYVSCAADIQPEQNAEQTFSKIIFAVLTKNFLEVTRNLG